MDHPSTHSDHYRKLLLMMALSFGAMYVLMYAMVDAYANVYNNQRAEINQMKALLKN